MCEKYKTMQKFVLVIILTLLSVNSSAQDWKRYFDSINRLSYEAHRAMLDRLGIDELRPGPSGDPSSPNAANSDESKAKTYSSLPDPLVFDNGNKVRSAADWQQRREEIAEHFSNLVYGRLPEHIPGVTWILKTEKDTVLGNIAAREKILKGIVDNSEYPAVSVEISLSVTLPAEAAEAVPVIMEFGWNFPGFSNRKPPGPDWKEMVLKKGWGVAILVPTTIQPDHGAGLAEGIIGLTSGGAPREPDDWGALRAWAWGAGRAMDYFETDPGIDASRVGIEGLSRYGKAALVTMAYDIRFSIALVGSSGAGGAKILRRNFGEQVENLASSAEYHWFAPNFVRYAGPLTPADLPVDAHHLVAMCAPRPVFISTGSPQVEGNWVDARGMFLAAVYASPVYELLGHSGLSKLEYPDEGEALLEDDIAFRQHEGGHTVGPNWPAFIQFAEKHF